MKPPRQVKARALRLIILAVAVFVLVGLTDVAWQLAMPLKNKSGSPIAFSLPSGATVKQVAAQLENDNIIRSQFWFESWVWLTGTETKFVAGEYVLPSSVNTVQLVKIFTSAVKPAAEVTLRLIEGWTIRDMEKYLFNQQWPAASQFKTYVTHPATVASAVANINSDLLQGKSETASLEGYLFPDTYRLYQKDGAAELVAKMLANFERKFEPSWVEAVHNRGYKVYEAVIMASIIEREVTKDGDRAKVADIFWRRFDAGRGLEADSTINYVTGKGLPAVTIDDTKLDSPYNTYRYRGLPPTPISNPSASALKAAIFPEPNPYWYFLTTRDGTVIYSRTFEDHVAAKNKYLK